MDATRKAQRRLARDIAKSAKWNRTHANWSAMTVRQVRKRRLLGGYKTAAVALMRLTGPSDDEIAKEGFRPEPGNFPVWLGRDGNLYELAIRHIGKHLVPTYVTAQVIFMSGALDAEREAVSWKLAEIYRTYIAGMTNMPYG